MNRDDVLSHAGDDDEDGSVLAQAVAWQEAGEQVALATVIETWGSAPRPVGSHLAVRSDGCFVGSVSGGCIEAAVVSGALACLDDDRSRLLDFGINAWEHGLSCGGRIRVMVHPLRDAAPLRHVRDERRRGATAALRIRLADGVLQPADAHGGSDKESFLRVYPPQPRLVVAGAVHIAEYLAPMASLAGFAVTICDPRRDFARRGTFAGAPVIDWPDHFFALAPPDRRTAVVSLTHVARLDDPTLTAALRSPAFYIGALGSRRTHEKRLVRLAAQGFGPDDLRRIDGPVGLPIGARSPAEIAVSITAALIAAWRR